MRPEDLRTLRGEVTKLLEQVQDLDGFAEKLGEVGPVPEEALEWRWSEVLAVCYGQPPGAIRWQDGIPAHEAPPGEAVILKLEEYSERVETFARECVFNAEWSARAVHDSLRLDASIRLPQAPERQFVISPVTVNIAAGSPLSTNEIERLRKGLELIEAQPLVDSNEGEGHRHHDRTLAEVEAKRLGQDSTDALEERERLMAPSGVQRSLRSSREAMWENALGYVRAGLLGMTRTDSQSAGYRNCSRYLNASVNGEWDARVPIEPTDSKGWSKIKSILRRAGRASRAARRQ